jgi:hypothetical protein
MKNGKELDRETLLKIFNVSKDSPLFNFTNDLAHWLVRNLEKNDIENIYEMYVGSNNKSIDEKINEIVEESYGRFTEEDLRKILNGEILYYSGDASNECENAVEFFLYENGSSLDYEDDIIKIEGGR